MKLSASILILIVAVMALSSFAASTVDQPSGPVPGKFIVKLAPGVTPANLTNALGPGTSLQKAFSAPVRAGLVDGDEWNRHYVYETNRRDMTPSQVAATLGRDNVEWVEPDYFLEFYDYPSDSLFSDQWYLVNDGQEYLGIDRISGWYNDELVTKSGTPGKDINIRPEYESPPTETTRVVVAIVDTGVDTEHPELQGRIWRNPGEIPYNQIDDDHNGFVDDTVGWDMSGDSVNYFHPVGDADPRDANGHGTHCAGIVAANADAHGTVGIAPNATIMPVKIRPNGTTFIGAASIVYAVNNGAQIINCSWGTPFQSQILLEALNFARRNGVLVCIAAGNSGDNTRLYPAGFDLDSTIVVGAGNSDGFVTYFSTYGAHLDIIAPGLDILSLRAKGTDMYGEYPGNEPNVRIIDSLYYLSDGTSMAAPMVCGAAARLLATRPDLNIAELQYALLHGATDMLDPFDDGDTLIGPDSLSGWGYLNIEGALSIATNGGLYITAPEHRTRYTGDIAIKAAAVGGYNGNWQLEYATGAIAHDWQPLASGASLPPDSLLYTFADPAYNGYVSFRLVDQYGQSSVVTVRYVHDNVLDLTSPPSGAEIEYSIPITGSAYGPDFDSVGVYYRRLGQDSVYLMSSTGEYYDSLFFGWSVSSADTGMFSVLVYGYYGPSVLMDSATVHVRSSFAYGWPQSIPGRAGMTAIACDLNNDGIKEIAAATTRGLVVFEGPTGELLPGFPVLADHDCRCVPAVYDLDHDGYDDIIVTDSAGIHAFRYDGTYVEGWPQACYTGLIPYEYAYPTPTVLALRNESEPGAVPDSAVMIINKMGQLIAYRFNGDRYFYSREMFGQMDARISYSYGLGGGTSPFVTSHDLNQDGIIEVVASYTSPAPYTGLGLFNGSNGQPAFNQTVPTMVTMRQATGTELADLDLDGRPEIITTGIDTTGHQRIWIKSNGATDFGSWIVPIPETWQGWLASYPIVADLDRDSIPEILMNFFEYDQSLLFIYRADGTPYLDPRPGIPIGAALYDSTTAFGTPAVADLTGDEYPEIVFRAGHLLPGTGSEMLYILNNQAEPVAGWPKATPARANSVASARYAPLIDDIDNDGLVELVLISEGGTILVWDFPTSSQNGENRFRFLVDNRNSGTLPITHESATTSGGMQTPVEIALDQNYPNPFNPDTRITFTLPVRQQVKIEVFNILGQLVTTLVDEEMDAGDHSIEFDGAGLANGVYFYRLTTDGAVISKKMLLVK